MTIPEFLAALTDMKDRYVWYEDAYGQLRARIPGSEGGDYTPMTALAEVRTGVRYDPLMDWDKAADILELTLEDASALVFAEDRDMRSAPALVRALRQAVGAGA